MISRREFLALSGGLLIAPSTLGAQEAQRGGAGPRAQAPREPLVPLAPLGKTAVLGAPTDTSVRLNVVLDEDMEAVVRVIDAAGAITSTPRLPLVAATPRDIALGGLAPGQAYRFELLARRQGEASASFQLEGRFHTARRAGEGFRFVVQADPHNRDEGFSEDLYQRTMALSLECEPDFLIDLGDNFMTEKMGTTEADALQCVRDMRRWYGLAAHRAPLFLMNGNHEAESGWLRASRDPALCLAANRLRRAYYPCPTPDGFYTGEETAVDGLGRPDVFAAWHWGDALFVLLDPFWYTTRKPGRGGINNGWDWTLGGKQYRWLAHTLRTSKARAKFVFCHHLVGGGPSARGGVEVASLYEWGGRGDDGVAAFERERPGWGTPIHDLMVETGVTVFFHGHDHFYAMQELDGVVYQLVPQPSHRNARRHMAEEYGYRSGVFLPSSGHLAVSVESDHVDVAYLRSDPRLAADSVVGHRYRRELRSVG